MLALGGWEQDVRPMAAPWDVADRWAPFAAEKGLSPLACDVLVEHHVRLCFRLREGSSLRWVTEDDLTSWKVDVARLRAHVTELARPRAAAPEMLEIDGMQARYARWVDGEGWSVAPFLWPMAVSQQLGPDVRFAMPAGTVALAWHTGDGQVDKALAVGVVELAEEQPGEVTRVVFRYDGERFVPYAEATPTPVPSP